jgi:2-iminobutanoate/2-iminopropanoate deaminase
MIRKPFIIVIVLAALLPLISVSTQAAPDRRVDVPVANPPAGRPTPPFSEGVASGDTFYIAGRIGQDPATGRAPDDPEVEARLVMDAIQQTLKQAGLTWDDAVSVTVYCTDLALYDHFNAVYRTYFHGRYPARAFIGVKELLFGGHFEVTAIAHVSHRS